VPEEVLAAQEHLADGTPSREEAGTAGPRP
jgi:hypothetical protein